MGESAILTMDADGGIVIPETIPQAQHLHSGDQLFIFEDETGMTLMSQDQLQAKVQADFAQCATSPVDELIAERRREARRDTEV